MSTSDFFGDSYAAARSKFVAAARTANARLTAYTLPHLRGPDNEALTVDVASLGPAAPSRVLLLISGTHGVEGLCGSGCQVGYLIDRLHEALPPGTGSILVHALNPYGFAWLRRVNEDNVDLSRNFHDFAQPLPSSAAYEEVHPWLVPADWGGPAHQAADRALQQHVASRGAAALQAAVSGGQYTQPSGLFYGGTKESWSNSILRRILRDDVPNSAAKLVSLDFHSGLGPSGYGEPIYIGESADSFERAKRWYGPEVTNATAGTSASAPVAGSLAGAMPALAPTMEVTHISLEYGTRPLWEVLTALRADHWLHATGNQHSPRRPEAQRQMREAFYIDAPAWKAAVYGRAADFVWRASRGLAGAR